MEPTYFECGTFQILLKLITFVPEQNLILLAEEGIREENEVIGDIFLISEYLFSKSGVVIWITGTILEKNRLIRFSQTIISKENEKNRITALLHFSYFVFHMSLPM